MQRQDFLNSYDMLYTYFFYIYLHFNTLNTFFWYFCVQNVMICFYCSCVPTISMMFRENQKRNKNINTPITWIWFENELRVTWC